jgi:hypothetical protein
MRVILVALSMLFCSFSALAKTLVSIAVLPPTTGYWLVTNTSTVQFACCGSVFYLPEQCGHWL